MVLSAIRVKLVLVFLLFHVCAFAGLLVSAYVYRNEILDIDIRFLFVLLEYPGYWLYNLLKNDLGPLAMNSGFIGYFWVFVFNGLAYSVAGFFCALFFRRGKDKKSFESPTLSSKSKRRAI
jgi:hypothetical protein